MARGKMVYVKATPKTSHLQTGHWSEKKKYECVCLWASGMSLKEVSLQTNTPYATVRQWRTCKWWEDIHKDIKSEDSQKLDAKLTKILDKTLESIMDRLENGEFVYDQKSGKLKRTPIKLRDATTAMNSVLDKRQLIRKEPTKIVESSSTAIQLQNLAAQFAAFVNKPKEEKLVDQYIDEVTVTQDEDGTYSLKE